MKKEYTLLPLCWTALLLAAPFQPPKPPPSPSRPSFPLRSWAISTERPCEVSCCCRLGNHAHPRRRCRKKSHHTILENDNSSSNSTQDTGHSTKQPKKGIKPDVENKQNFFFCLNLQAHSSAATRLTTRTKITADPKPERTLLYCWARE